MKTVSLVLATLALLPAALAASSPNSAHTLKLDEGAAPARATLADFTWLAGHWIGTGFGGAHVEEMWTAPLGASMQGMFRLVRDGRAQVYEQIVLVAVGDTVEMRLKHFDAQLKGWEQKDEFVAFPLVRHEPRAAYFAGLTYRLDDDGGLRVWLVTKGRDGAASEQEMLYRRAR